MKAPIKKLMNLFIGKMEDWKSDLEQFKNDMEITRDELQEAYDSHSEKWMEGEAAEKAQAEIDAIENIISSLEGTNDDMDEVIGNIQEITEGE